MARFKHNRSADSYFSAISDFDWIFFIFTSIGICFLAMLEGYVNTRNAANFVLEKPLYAEYAKEISFSQLTHIWIKSTISYALSIWAVFTAFMLCVQVGFRGVTRSVQRITTFFLTAIYIFLAYKIYALTNDAPYVSDLSTLPKIGFFRSIKTILIFAVLVFSVLPFLTNTSRVLQKARRLTLLIFIFLLYLIADWQLSKSHLHVDKSYIDGTNIPTFYVFLPDTTSKELEEALSSAALVDMRQHIQGRYNIIPNSNFYLPQLTSALSQLETTEHGVRTDYDSGPQLEYGKLLIEKNFLRNFDHIHTSNPGELSYFPLLLNGNINGTKCLEDIRSNIYLTATLNLKIPFAILPQFYKDSFFDIYKCSLSSANLSEIFNSTFDEVTLALQDNKKFASVLWLNFGAPEFKNKVIEVFWREWALFIRSRNIKNYNLTLVGLTKSLEAPGGMLRLNNSSTQKLNNVPQSLSIRSIKSPNTAPNIAYYENINSEFDLVPESTDILNAHFALNRSEFLYKLFRADRYFIDLSNGMKEHINNDEFLLGNDIGFALTHGIAE